MAKFVSMRVVFVAALLYPWTAVKAEGSVVVSDEATSISDRPTNVIALFDADPETARAWVNVEIFGKPLGDPQEGVEKEMLHKKITGLSFDAKTEEIVYHPTAPGAAAIVCGKYEPGYFLKKASVVPTGRCELTIALEGRRVDNGFHYENKNFVKVSLAWQ